MPVRLDTIARGATAAVDRNSPKARQDKWMLEVERAMFASAQPPAAPFTPVAPGTAPAAIAPAIAETGTAPALQARRMPAGGEQHARHASADAPVRAAAAHARDDRNDAGVDGPVAGSTAAPAGATIVPPASGTGGIAANAAVAGAPASGLTAFASARYAAMGGAAGMAPANGAPAGAPGTVPGPAAAAVPTKLAGPTEPIVAPDGGTASVPASSGGGVTAAPAPALAPAGNGRAEALPTGGVGAPTPDVAPAPEPAGIGAAGGSAAPARSGFAAAPVASAAMLHSLAAGAGTPEPIGFLAPEAPAAEEQETAPTSRRAATQASAGTEHEPYAQSNVHVIDGDDGIHAWVRDARMTPRQEQAVAQAMIAQFVQQGGLVGSVTVNGRLHGARDEAERDEQGLDHSTSEPPSTAAGTTTTVRGVA